MSKITVTTIAGATSGADANKVKIESGDQLGVGTTPTHPLTVNGQIKSIGSNGETVQLQTSNQFSGVSFIGSDGTRDAIMDYDHTNGVMSLKAHTAGHLINFTTGGYTERFRITDNGVTFNGDTAAANALDDYEEGTFTGVGMSAASGGAFTITSQDNAYVKIGKFVKLRIKLIMNTPSSASGNITLSGLPFASDGIYGMHIIYNNQSAAYNNDGGFFIATGTTAVKYGYSTSYQNVTGFQYWLEASYRTT